MGRSEMIELTVLCLLTHGEKLLLQNRVKKDWAGYTLPGGHVEPGESVVEAVIREMREETGLTVQKPRLCGIKQFPGKEGRYLVFLFRSDSFTGELQSSSEGKMEWIRRDRLDEYKTVADFRELLQVMEAEELTEFQYVLRGDQWDVLLH